MSPRTTTVRAIAARDRTLPSWIWRPIGWRTSVRSTVVFDVLGGEIRDRSTQDWSAPAARWSPSPTRRKAAIAGDRRTPGKTIIGVTED